MLKFKNYARLLALANSPGTGHSILDWRPFVQGRKLGKIIDDFNAECMRNLQALKWLDEYIEMLGEGIDVVLHDLASLNELRIKDFEKIKVLLVDLDAVEGKMGDEIEKLKVFMASHQKYYHLPQVSRKPGAMSLVSRFKPLAIVPSTPEILTTEDQFAGFLQKLSTYYVTAVSNICEPTLPPIGEAGAARSSKSYIARIARTAADVRDSGINKNLSVGGVKALAQRAWSQERALFQVEDWLWKTERSRISLDAIRTPTYRISAKPMIEKESLESVNLVKVNVNRPFRLLTDKQRGELKRLGIKEKTHASVHWDLPNVWTQVGNLKDIVKATRFSAELPMGSMKKSKGGGIKF